MAAILVSGTAPFVFNIMPANAALETGLAVEYVAYVSKFELSTNGGGTWVTVFEGTSTGVNMGSAHVSKGAYAGDFLSGLTVPDGTYNRVKVTPSGAFSIKGSITYNTTIYYTTSSARSGGGVIASTSSSSYDSCSITISGTTAQEYDASATPIVVENGTATRRIRVSFNVDNGLGIYAAPPLLGHDYEIYPEPPVVTMSIQ